MKHKRSNRILSILLALVMILGLLPTMAYAATYIKMGEIKTVTAESQDFAPPALDAPAKPPVFTVTSPTDENVSIAPGAPWQKYNDQSKTWEEYSKPVFDVGTYRLRIMVSSVCFFDSRTYYALQSNTSLTVNGTPWTAESLDDRYEAAGYGEMIFVSPEYRVVDYGSINMKGNVNAVTITTWGADIRPVLGRTVENVYPAITAKDPAQASVNLVDETGCWQILKSDGTWEIYNGSTFKYGTYRMVATLRSTVQEDSYYALTMDTKLIADGVQWDLVAGSYMEVCGDGTCYSKLTFVSQEMEAIPALDVYDGTVVGCHVVPTLGEFTVPLGDNFSFTIEPDDHYELTDPDALEVYVNETLVKSDANGVYTVPTADTDGVNIYVEGDAFTGYSNLLISANGKTATEKVYVGDTYTFITLATIGATVPSGSSFTGWKLGGKTYQPGETYTVVGTTDIKVEATFAGLHNITVVNGKAYADEAHTQPISAAAEDQVIYIVADEAPEGKVFGYWSHQEVATPGGNGWFGSYDSAQTTYTVYYSDVVIAPVYETLIDEIVINGMTKPSVGVAIDNSDYSYKWGCSVPANSGYSLGINYWYDITDEEPVAMSNGDVFHIGHTYRFQAKISLYGDTIFPANAEDISVTLTGIDDEDYEWTLNEIDYRYEYAVIYFEFTCEREMPDSSYERPVGYGTKSDPFRISTVGELYWFSAFVNEKVTAPDLVVEPETACAILMNDITVNPNLLHTDGTLIGAYGFERWIPIGYYSKYSGTFEGQGHTISGLYFDHGIPYTKHRDIGFVANLNDGGCVRLLTIADSWFATPSAATDFYLGGVAGYVGDGSIVGCSFRGVIKANTDYYLNSVGGIAGVNNGTIDDCWVMGWVKAYSTYGAGGIVGSASGTVKNSLNYAEVINTFPTLTGGGSYSATGGIVGILREGTVTDCRNIGIVGGGHFVGGIAGHAYGSQGKQALINRCFNEGDVGGSGIVERLGDGTLSSATANGSATVGNCYNKGSVLYGICEYANGSANTVSYCHNVGIFTQQPILGGAAADSDIIVERCYYQGSSEFDTLEGTAYKTSAEFADGTVLALLDNGNWNQGPNYPILEKIKGVTVSGTVTSFNSDTDSITIELYEEGSTSADYTATVKGNTAEYSIEGVAEGTYTMTVSKANHVTRTYTVTVGSSNVTQDAKIHLIGDITGDGRVNVADTSKAYAHAKGTAELTGYAFACGEVSGDGRINVADTSKIYAHAKGTNPLF